MKKRRKPLLWIIPAVLVLLLAVAAFWQRENIRSLLLSFRYSTEELEQMQEDEEAVLAEKLELDLEDIRRQAEEMVENSGEAPIFDEESGTLRLPEDHEDGSDPTPGTDGGTGMPRESSADVLAKFYAQQASYTGALQSMEGAAYSEYMALPREKHNKTGKLSVINRYIGMAYSMEAVCDGEVARLLERLRTALRNEGKDEALVNDVRSYYYNQKAAFKAQMLEKYKRHLS